MTQIVNYGTKCDPLIIKFVYKIIYWLHNFRLAHLLRTAIEGEMPKDD
jgi:hypothetical protein